MTVPHHLSDIPPEVRYTLEGVIDSHRQTLAAQLQEHPLRVLEYVLERELDARTAELVSHLLAVHPTLPKRHACAAVGLALGRSLARVRDLYYQEARR